MTTLSKKDKQGIWLLCGVLLALVGLFVVKINLDRTPKPGADNCTGRVTENTVIVLDHTERISDQTSAEIFARAMAHIRDNVRVNERVSIFTISDISKKSLQPLVSLCRPPDDGNRAIENPQLIKKRFQEKFEQPVRRALKMVPDDALESPIAQALTDISLSEYLRGDRNTLLVFSDMLENTRAFSMYRCNGGSDVIKLFRESRRGAMERPEIKNTAVVLNLVPRLNQAASTLKCRDRLWPWFFGNNEGSSASLKVDYLPGGTPARPKGLEH